MFPKRFQQIINPSINYLYGPKKVYKKFPSGTYYKIKTLTPSDNSATWNLIKNAYLVGDPLCILLDIAKSNDIHMYQKLIEFGPSEGISLKAVTNDHKEEIMGVCINNKFCPSDLQLFDKFCEQCTDEKMRSIFKCYRQLLTSYNIFEKHNHPYAFEIGILSVDQKHQRKGIGYGLIRASLSLARDMGYPMATIQCTSAYSALICDRCQMELVKTIPYGKLELGKVPDYPHCDVKIYVTDFKEYHKLNKENYKK